MQKAHARFKGVRFTMNSILRKPHPINTCLKFGLANHLVFIALLLFTCVGLFLLILNGYGKNHDDSGIGLVYMFLLGPLFAIQALVEGIVLLLLLLLPAFKFSNRESINTKIVLAFLLTIFGAIGAYVVTYQIFTLVVSRESGSF